MLGIGIGVPFAAAPKVVALDPIVTAYAAAVATAGGSLSGAVQSAVNSFVVATKAAGVWAKLTEVGLFLGGTPGTSLSGCAVKLKALGAANVTLNSFVAADLTAAGLVGDGSTKWIDTGTSVTQASATGPMGMGAYLTSEVAQGTYGMIIGTNEGGTPQLGLRWQAVANSIDLAINGSGAPSASATKVRNKMLKGLVHGSRVANQLTIYNGGMPASTNTSAFTYTGAATTLGVLSENGGGAKLAATVGGYFLDNGTMTDSDAQVLALAFNTLMGAIGRMPQDTRSFNYIPSIGQSLALGTQGTPVVSTTQAYLNIVNDAGINQGNISNPTPGYWENTGTGQQAATATPLVELGTESHASGMLNTISQMSRAASLGSAWDSMHVNYGLGATAYSGLAKGTTPYANAIATAAFAKTIQPAYTTGAVRVPYIPCVHGESDWNNASYDANIRQWQSDYQGDYNALFGTSGTIPMFHSQPSSWTSPNNGNSATAIAPYKILAESKLNPTLTLCVCPKYFLTHYTDGVHLNPGTQYRTLGEYYGKAIYQHVVQGVQWIPLRIKTVTRAAAVITVVLEGAVGNIQFDTTNVTDPSGASLTKGFEYTDSAGGGIYARIASVAITSQSPPTIQITLTADPSANTGRTLSYAYTGTVGNSGGPTTGPRGNVKDSDTRVGPSGTALNNWLLHDQWTVP